MLKNYLAGMIAIIMWNTLILTTLSSPEDGMHHRTGLWVVWVVIALSGTVAAANLIPDCSRHIISFVCGLMGGALMASLLDAFSNHMWVHNQFALGIGENAGFYFNMPDIIMVLGFFFLSFAIISSYLKEQRAKSAL